MTWCTLICIWCRCSVCGVLFCDYVMVMTASLINGRPTISCSGNSTISTFATPHPVCAMPGLATFNVNIQLVVQLHVTQN